MKFDKKDLQRIRHNRRYYSHRMIKKHLKKMDKKERSLIIFNPRERTIFCNDVDALKPILRKHIIKLSNLFGYNIQTFPVFNFDN